MELAEVLKELAALASKDVEATATRRGVPAGRLLGVRTADLRKYARQIGENRLLAEKLWSSEVHEAHILAILIAPPDTGPDSLLIRWVADIDSWGVCDQLAKRLATNLTAKNSGAKKEEKDGDRDKEKEVLALVGAWVADASLYVRRAGLALLANFCMKQHKLSEAAADLCVAAIVRTASDDRQHVRQACCWALRELGKIDTGNHEIATSLALELSESAVSAEAWVGRCAYRELETLVKVPERRRLISGRSKTAGKHTTRQGRRL